MRFPCWRLKRLWHGRLWPLCSHAGPPSIKARRPAVASKAACPQVLLRDAVARNHGAGTGRSHPAIGGYPGGAGKDCSAGQRGGKSGDELDEVGLTTRAGLLVEMGEMAPDRLRRNPQRLRHLGHAPDFNNAEQDAQLARG